MRGNTQRFYLMFCSIGLLFSFSCAKFTDQVAQSTKHKENNIKQVILTDKVKKLPLQVSKAEAVYGYFTTVADIENNCDAIIVGVPTKDFINRDHYVQFGTGGDPVQEWSIGPINVSQILYIKPGVTLGGIPPTGNSLVGNQTVANQTIQVAEPVGVLSYPQENLLIKTTMDDCSELLNGSKYILCLQKNSSMEWSTINLNIGRFNIDGTDPKDNVDAPGTNTAPTLKRQLLNAMIQRYGITVITPLPIPTLMANAYHGNDAVPIVNISVGYPCPPLSGSQIVVETTVDGSAWTELNRVAVSTNCVNGTAAVTITTNYLAGHTVAYRARMVNGSRTSYYSDRATVQ